MKSVNDNISKEVFPKLWYPMYEQAWLNTNNGQIYKKTWIGVDIRNQRPQIKRQLNNDTSK